MKRLVLGVGYSINVAGAGALPFVLHHASREIRQMMVNSRAYLVALALMVGVLTSELGLLLANIPQLGGRILPKETGVQG